MVLSKKTRAIFKRVLLPLSPLWDPPYVWWVKRQTGFAKPIPPIDVRRLQGGTGANAAWFVESGTKDAQVFKTAINQYSPRPLSECRVLDFGAGTGRLLGHFDGLCQELYATDVDPEAVRYLQKHFPEVKTVSNSFEPPLTFPDNFFDLIISFSVWTHLSETDQLSWLRELSRLLKPDGMAFISAHTAEGLEPDKKNSTEWIDEGQPQLDLKGFYFVSYSNEGLAALSADRLKDTSPRYGYNVQTPEHIRTTWGRILEVKVIEELAFRKHQALVVLKKSSS